MSTVTFGYFSSNDLLSALSASRGPPEPSDEIDLQRDGAEVLEPVGLDLLGRRAGRLLVGLVLTRRPAAPGDGDRQRDRQGRERSVSSSLLSLSLSVRRISVAWNR